MSKRAVTKFDMETPILKKLKKVEIVEQYGLNISNRIAGLEN